jgi:hypothetical protein
MILCTRFTRLSLSALTLIAACVSGISSASADAGFNEKANEALGATLVAHCVSSHLNLDLVCSSVAADEMEKDRASKLVEITIQLVDQVGPQVDMLAKTDDCGEEDRKILEIIAKSYEAIDAEAQALQKYIDSDDDADLEAFKAAQTTAKEQIGAIGK